VAQVTAVGHLGRPSQLARFGAWLAGPKVTRRLSLTQAVDHVADSLITLSLIGSLFFSVSLEASRTRILLYLLLTAAPLAIVAQLVGPALDRIRAGSRIVLISSHVARAVFALLLASSLLSLAFYPLVFGLLVSRKAYALGKTAIIAQVAPQRLDLAAATGHLARIGAIAGGLGTALGGVLIPLFGVKWLPVVAAGLFLVAGVLALRVKVEPVEHAPETAVLRVEAPLHVRRAASAVAVIRAAEGALTFLLALTIKRGGGDTWIFVSALVAAGVGTFLGSIVSQRLHRGMSSDGIVLLTLLGPGLMSTIGVLTIGSFSIIVIAFAIALGGSVASRSIDVLYSEVPQVMRGRVISRNELLFQLTNVAGAALAVLVYPGPRVGFAAVAAGLMTGGLTYAWEVRLALRHEARRWLSGPRPPQGALPLALLAEAIRFKEQGDHDVSIVVADSAVRALAARQPPPALNGEANWAALHSLVADVVAGRVVAGPDDASAVIEAAAALIGDATH
jgi:predicted MFS family arabinose efflux permease